MNKRQIQNQNKKAMPKFLILLILSSLVGMFFGFCISAFDLTTIINLESFNNGVQFFNQYISVFLLFFCVIIIIAYTYPMCKRAKEQYEKWDGEQEEVIEKIEKSLSKVVWMSGSILIISFFLMSALCYSMFSIRSLKQFQFLFAGLVFFIFILYACIRVQQKGVDLTKQINPEKNGSVYDLKFHEKWLNSCDEAEKILIGQCAYKAYVVTSHVCIFLIVILIILAPIFHFGIVPSFVVSLIWFVNTFVYCRESLKK